MEFLNSQPYYASNKNVIQPSDFPVRRTGSYRHKKALITTISLRQFPNNFLTELKLLRLTESFRRELKTFLFNSVCKNQDTDRLTCDALSVGGAVQVPQLLLLLLLLIRPGVWILSLPFEEDSDSRHSLTIHHAVSASVQFLTVVLPQACPVNMPLFACTLFY